MPHISVVIPVYKAENCLHELYRRLKVSLASITPDFEIVLVEDCGGDRSWEIIEELAKTDSRVKGIQFSRNFGQHYGITAGIDHCDGDWSRKVLLMNVQGESVRLLSTGYCARS
jgi:glycosyltransferase involved in cell wall biosynthesis